MEQTPRSALSEVAALAEPTRRRLYDFVARAADPVGRDDAAAALGLPRNTAAFHLDRLAEDGLLEVEFQRRSGREGPGAGRPAKLYRRSTRQVSLTLPPRSYDLAGELLASALEDAESTGEPPREALARRARDLGRQLGEDRRADREGLTRILEDYGFEPRAEDSATVLGNCPFHALATRHTELVCGMNKHLLDGLLDGLAETGLQARLAPAPGRCCVVLEPAP